MKLRVTVNQVEYDVDVEILDDGGSTAVPVAASKAAAPAAKKSEGGASGKTLNSPIPGTVIEIKVAVGQAVKANDVVIVLDAMKMNTNVPCTADGVVKEILIKMSDPVKMGQPLIVFE